MITWRKKHPKGFTYYVTGGMCFWIFNEHKTEDIIGNNDYPYNFRDLIEIFGLDDDKEIEVLSFKYSRQTH